MPISVPAAVPLPPNTGAPPITAAVTEASVNAAPVGRHVDQAGGDRLPCPHRRQRAAIEAQCAGAAVQAEQGARQLLPPRSLHAAEAANLARPRVERRHVQRPHAGEALAHPLDGEHRRCGRKIAHPRPRQPKMRFSVASSRLVSTNTASGRSGLTYLLWFAVVMNAGSLGLAAP